MMPIFEYLRDLIVNGRAKPSQIVSHRIPIGEAPDAYDKFDKDVGRVGPRFEGNVMKNTGITVLAGVSPVIRIGTHTKRS